MSRTNKKDVMKFLPRGSWGKLNPTQKPHSPPKGKRQYNRKDKNWKRNIS